VKPTLDDRILRACGALGALGAICTLAIDARGGAAQVTASPFAWPTAARPAAEPMFGTKRTHREHATIDPAIKAVKRMITAGDRIARLPYAYGGGHGSFTASGYDCSGSASYVLHAGGLIGAPLDSSGLEGYGLPGPGKHVTVYANGGHAWMTIDGRRFDTIAFQETGTRWSSSISSPVGYVVRHPRGF
jgi:hypothetical protein